MKRPLISVVIPVLNERDRVGTLVGELSHANSAPFEIIVIDGGCNDGTIEAAQNLDAQAAITIGVSEPGRGPQFVAGAAQAAGDILWFLHVDSHVFITAIHAFLSAAISMTGSGAFSRWP